MDPAISAYLTGLFNTILWSAVAIIIVVIVFEVLDRRYHLMKEIFEENSTAAAIFAGSFVVGIFFTVVSIVTH
ncbi:MAG: DUF350 domain-containing protein [Chloroflexota bacterium]